MTTSANSAAPARPRTVLVQIAIGDYRNHFLTAVASAHADLQIITGDVHLEPSYRASPNLAVPVTRVTNCFLLGRRLVWQRHSLRPALAAEVCVIEHNPRFINAWLVVLARRLAGRRTVVWGHVDSRGGHRPVMGFLRHLQRRLAGVALYYTETEKALAASRHGEKPDAFVAPNSLYTAADWSAPAESRPSDFLVIGRLAQDKRPDVAIRAFLLADLPPGSTLHVVGDGPLRPQLEALAREPRPTGRDVLFHGHVSDQKALADLFSRSAATLSPGYVGLSLVQSTYFGCPLIYSLDQPHAPEITLAVEGFNALGVPRCEPENFARVLPVALRDFSDRGKRLEIARHSLEHASIEYMSAGFLAAVNHAYHA
jgi:glycosyltransferase involved in cell wall biosynthesis